MSEVQKDSIRESFLLRQREVAQRLSDASDLVKLEPVFLPGDDPAGPPQRYVAEFSCGGLVKLEDGQVAKGDRFVVGIFFPCHYLRRAHVAESLTWLWPRSVFHPNIFPPVICVGSTFLMPGTGLEQIVYQVHSIITYTRWASHDGLNPEACQWARNHQEQFPVDRRPLKRRTLDVRVETRSQESEAPHASN